MRDLGTLQHVAYERLYGERLNDYKSDGLILRHKKTGARICLLSNDDENKVFSIGFRTPPEDSTGVAHIIEHSVLCGSQKYPLKDPFMELAKGSLNTFLNAMTYPDKTIYPVASCNDKDFHNLVDVYMDAVLHPNIYKNEKIFRQEGWRYELESADAPLTLNGVVYSEMKGAFSDPEGVMFRYAQNALFPDNAYSIVSGGDPAVIPELTYERFLDFHRRFYHPSNSFIYLYGDMDMYEYLEYLDREYLCHYEAAPVESQVLPQKPYGVCEQDFEFAIGEGQDEKDSAILVFGTVTSADDPVYCTAWNAVQYVLFNAPGAPIKQALIDAGIGTDIQSAEDVDLIQPMFLLYAKGADASRKQEFFDIITREAEKIVEKGINRKSLLGYLVSNEFSVRELDSGRYPTGLNILGNIFDGWLYDERRAFAFCHPIERYTKLRTLIDTDYFENIVRETILSHKHELHMVGIPKKGMIEQQEKELAASLAAYKESLSEEAIQKIIADRKALTAWQETPDTPEELATIPLLQRTDIRREIRTFPLEKSEAAGVPVLHYNVNANGIVYLNLSADITDMPLEELPYAAVLITILLQMDTSKHSYEDLNDELSLHVGSMNSAMEVYGIDADYRAFHGALVHRMKFLSSELDTAFSLFTEMICDLDLSDRKRLLEILQETKSSMRSGLTYSGHTTARLHCLSYFFPGAKFMEQSNGIDFYEFLSDLVENYEKRADELVSHIQRIMSYCVSKKRLTVAVTSDAADFEKVVKKLPEFLQALTTLAAEDRLAPAEKLPWEGGYSLSAKNEAYSFSGKVNYVARAGWFKAHGYQESGALSVLRSILSNEYLWQNVRVKGGAYGCGIQFSNHGGTMCCASYRDPNLSATDEVYQRIPEYVRSLNLSERELTKYVIGTFSGMDRPLSVSAAGEIAFNYYFSKVPMEKVQKLRDEILAVTNEEICAQADLLAAALSDGYVCALVGEGNIKNDALLFREVKPLK